MWRDTCMAGIVDSVKHQQACVSVLVGDVYQICLAGLRKLLEEEFQVAGWAYDGQRLVRIAAELRPDVIVTEILTQFSTAEELVRRLHQACRRSKIIILTSRRDAWSARQSIEAGASGYILKDDTPHELISAIHSIACGASGILSPGLGEPGKVSENAKLGILTPRQRQILRLLAEGRTQKEIASIIDVSIRTVEFHKYELMRRLAVRNNAELMALAVRHELLDSHDPLGL